VARSPARPRALQWQVFLGAQAVDHGIVTPYQLRSSAWISPLHGVYADSRLDCDHGLRCRAAALRLPAGVTFAGPSAAWLYGVEFAAGYGDPVRTAWDLAQWLDLVEAVTAVDGLLRLRLTSRTELLERVAEQAGRRGVLRAGRVFDLVDAGAQSPAESRLRVRFIRAGLPRPVTQFPITLRSGLVVHPDLAWPEYRVAVEYDGTWHDSPDQFHFDRRRLNQLVAEGWIVLHVTSRRMRELPAVVDEVRRALRSRGWHG